MPASWKLDAGRVAITFSSGAVYTDDAPSADPLARVAAVMDQLTAQDAHLARYGIVDADLAIVDDAAVLFEARSRLSQHAARMAASPAPAAGFMQPSLGLPQQPFGMPSDPSAGGYYGALAAQNFGRPTFPGGMGMLQGLGLGGGMPAPPFGLPAGGMLGAMGGGFGGAFGGLPQGGPLGGMLAAAGGPGVGDPVCTDTWTLPPETCCVTAFNAATGAHELCSSNGECTPFNRNGVCTCFEGASGALCEVGVPTSTPAGTPSATPSNQRNGALPAGTGGVAAALAAVAVVAALAARA